MVRVLVQGFAGDPLELDLQPATPIWMVKDIVAERRHLHRVVVTLVAGVDVLSGTDKIGAHCPDNNPLLLTAIVSFGKLCSDLANGSENQKILASRILASLCTERVVPSTPSLRGTLPE